jgi:hypothetical protein
VVGLAVRPAEVEEIYEFFAAQIAQDVRLDVLLARAAELAACRVGVVAGRVRRSASPDGTVVDGANPVAGAARRRLRTGESVWVERASTADWDRALLDELAVAVRVALIRHPQSRTSQQLLDIACDVGSGERQRVEALGALGFPWAATIRCLAIAGPPAAVDRLASTVIKRSSRTAIGCRASGRVRIVLARDFTDPYEHDVPVGVQMGVSRALPTAATPMAVAEAMAALRFSQPSPRDRGPYLLEECCVVTSELVTGTEVLADRLSADDLAGVPDVQALDELIAAAGPEMLRTLDVVASSESYRKAAERLHMHHNSVAQRVARAERVLGYRLSDPYGRPRLFLDSSCVGYGPRQRWSEGPVSLMGGWRLSPPVAQ